MVGICGNFNWSSKYLRLCGGKEEQMTLEKKRRVIETAIFLQKEGLFLKEGSILIG
ncbi:hypothetical protein [Methanosarcina siciliae]|uniref:hypothetical protein n=1 Tax=Methanosarcina siciliae TaxID=38027 RepID=UPI000A42BFB8|nr:hypothetical protein [Methanosarcina siciliae]